MQKKVKKLALVTMLFVPAMTCLSTGSHAAKICDYEYYYDAARTQVAGQCFAACYAGGNYCIGELTEYYALVNCRPGCSPDDPSVLSSSTQAEQARLASDLRVAKDR